jgi:two-component system LytT family response regulator
MTTTADPGRLLRVLIVDDEELARVRLRRYFEQKHPDYVLQEAADGVEALARIAEFFPDVIFLDIEMPELSGFEVLMQLEARPFAIVFQTAYADFAVRAFEENACDYLLKPFTDVRLETALAKARGGRADLPGLERQLASQAIHLRKLVIRAGTRQRIIDHKEVLYFSSESHATRVVLRDIDYAYDHSLSFLEARLDPQLFLRIHRNAIVNLGAVRSVTQGLKPTVVLENGVELQVARDRKRALRDRLKTV